MNILDFAGYDLEDNPGNNAEHNTGSNRIGKGHHNNSKETADRIGNISVKVHTGNVLDHQQTNKNQCRCRSERRHC